MAFTFAWSYLLLCAYFTLSTEMTSNEERFEAIVMNAAYNTELQPDLNALKEGEDYCAFNVSTISKSSPPKPKTTDSTDTGLKFGVEGFTKLPWSTDNVVENQKCYAVIEKALEDLASNGAKSVEDVINTIKQYASWVPSFDGLRDYVESKNATEQQKVLETMTGIAKLAVKAKSLITEPLPLLLAKHTGSVTLSQEQCACLLANGFFCTFPKEASTFNKINFAGIFQSANHLSHVRLQFLLHYFSLVLEKMPTGCVTFSRAVLKEDAIPKWEEEKSQLHSLAVQSEVPIEDVVALAQVDFANETIGGLVLSTPIDQIGKEEIRFLISPELIVSCLLCEKMGPLEAIHIVGTQRYSGYSGYGSTVEWQPYDGYDCEERDSFRRVFSDVIAIDALSFSDSSHQYERENIDRELKKAYAGFMSEKSDARPIATGGWGCGVLRGDKELKSLIQIVAAAKAGRDMVYCAFHDKQFEDSLLDVYNMLVQRNVTIRGLYKALISYAQSLKQQEDLSVFKHISLEFQAQ
ncbi:unnamed protein product [Cylicocyclus nassatus]|uniref:poly(ADP-ribose) glycohydrolase n=1 Tax=Cylicocyclus nassatus TaxID=53992 RepID=A0AA36MDE3_CYLNA|nr:unnamed protein product [Cylicocyclus nassatus]